MSGCYVSLIKIFLLIFNWPRFRSDRILSIDSYVRNEQRVDIGPPSKTEKTGLTISRRTLSCRSAGATICRFMFMFGCGWNERVFRDHPAWGCKVVLLDRIVWFRWSRSSTTKKSRGAAWWRYISPTVYRRFEKRTLEMSNPLQERMEQLLAAEEWENQWKNQFGEINGKLTMMLDKLDKIILLLSNREDSKTDGKN
jgi:hypothetical protein